MRGIGDSEDPICFDGMLHFWACGCCYLLLCSICLTSDALMKPLKIGDSINKGHIGISLGASWTYGLYYDCDSKVWFRLNRFWLGGGGRMKAGDLVTIYEDPLTEKKPEGEAKLIRRTAVSPLQKCKDGMGLEQWLVEFLSDKAKCYRWIKKEELKQ